MEESKKLDFDKEISEMEQLISVVKQLKECKHGLATWYEISAQNVYEGIDQNSTDVTTGISLKLLEYLEKEEKSYEKQIEVFQLNAEIEQKELILAELKKRAEEDTKTTETFAKEADIALPDKIKRAKELVEDKRVPKDVRIKLKAHFVDPYQSRYRLSGFKDEGTKAAFYKAIILMIEAAEHWTVTKK